MNRGRVAFFVIHLILFTIFSSQTVYALNAKKQILDNGLVVLHYERQNLPIVKISLLIKASSLDEPRGLNGLSYLTSEMLMEGTKTRTSKQISEEVEFMGARLSTSTNKDYTVVSLSALKKDINTGFKIFSDVLLNPRFSQKELTHKKETIKGNLKKDEESPGFLAKKAFKKEVFGNHPYGRPVRGRPETIDKISRADLFDFHSSNYLPKNSILVCVGDISYTSLKGLIDRNLNTWTNKNINVKPTKKIEKRPTLSIVKINRDITQTNILFGKQAIKRSDPDYYAVSVMNYILGGGGFASRLMEIIRDNKGLAYDVHSVFNANKYGGTFEVVVQTKNEFANTVIKEIINQIHKIKTESVTDNELKNAKAYLTGSFPRRIDTMDRIAVFLALTEFYGLGMDYDKKYPKYINAVTKEDVERVAKKYLPSDDFALVVVGNQNLAKIKHFKELKQWK